MVLVQLLERQGVNWGVLDAPLIQPSDLVAWARGRMLRSIRPRNLLAQALISLDRSLKMPFNDTGLVSIR